MNNKETLQSYNNELIENNVDLSAILNTIKDLPETGSGEDLSDELATYDSELTRQETSIADIIELLNKTTKPSGEIDTTVLNEVVDFSAINFDNISVKQDGTTGSWGGWYLYKYVYVGDCSKIIYGNVPVYSSGETYLYGIVFYDINFTYISGIGINEADSSVDNPTTAGKQISGESSIPDGAKYIRIGYVDVGDEPNVPNVTLVRQVYNISNGGEEMIKYSTEEQVIGEWIDGRPLYSRTFIGGALPDTGTLDVPYDIENLDKFIDIRGIAYNGEFALLLPCSHQTDDSCINLYAWYADNKICVQTFSDRSSYTENYITAQYIKKVTS